MLRASIDTDHMALHPSGIVTGMGDTGVPAGAALLAFTDAVVLRDTDEYDDARAKLVAELGHVGADRAAMVAGNFSMMNRALDAVGAPVDRGFESLATEMGLEIPAHLVTARP